MKKRTLDIVLSFVFLGPKILTYLQERKAKKNALMNNLHILKGESLSWLHVDKLACHGLT
jgi:hypothetical protein